MLRSFLSRLDYAALVPAALLLAAFLPGASVHAQAPGPGVERVAGPAAVSPARGDGVRLVAPGALMFASLDADHDGKVTDAEISSGAAVLFARADRNGDKQITAFEQGDWASAMGAGSDVLSNPMLFDTDLDRSITEAEFRSGLVRLAASLRAPGVASLAFDELVRPLNPRSREEAPETSPDGVDRVGGPPGVPPRR
jgi:hypothetical protein